MMISLMFYRLTGLILLVLSLVACQKPDAEHYFLQNPHKLEKFAEQCLQQQAIKDSQASYCQIAINRWKEIADYKLEMMINPYGFGQKIMNAETVLAKAATDLAETEKLMHQLKQNQQKDSEKSAVLQKRYQQQKSQYDSSLQQVKWLLVAINLANQR